MGVKGNSEELLKVKPPNVIYLEYSEHLYCNAVVKFGGLSC